MKKCILIIGTNAVGKSTLARNIIRLSGGISQVEERVTYCNDGKTAVIGDYSKGKKIEGVDAFAETKCVKGIIEATDRENVVFEGLKCGTFGLSIQGALFASNKQLVVFLYASAKTINERLLKRSSTGIKSKQVLLSQKNNLNSALKYKEIGVPVICFDTEKFTEEEIAEKVMNKINEL